MHSIQPWLLEIFEFLVESHFSKISCGWTCFSVKIPHSDVSLTMSTTNNSGIVSQYFRVLYFSVPTKTKTKTMTATVCVSVCVRVCLYDEPKYMQKMMNETTDRIHFNLFRCVSNHFIESISTVGFAIEQGLESLFRLSY